MQRKMVVRRKKDNGLIRIIILILLLEIHRSKVQKRPTIKVVREKIYFGINLLFRSYPMTLLVMVDI